MTRRTKRSMMNERDDMDQTSDLKTLLDANAKFADEVNIPKAVRVTTRKPFPWEISLHQMRTCMMGVCEGIHPPFSQIYIRRVRVENS